MVKLTHIFILSVLFFWLAGSGCVENNKDAQEAGLVPDIPGTDSSKDTSAEQELTEADIQEFEENVTDLEDLLENSSEEIVVEEL